MKHAIAVALLSVSTSAFAQTSTTTTVSPGATSSETYFVVQEPSTKRCTISTSKPTGTTTTVVGGDGTVYKSRTEAETAMKKVTTCTQ